ncbi:MAG: molybdopterin oxidoreductase family protein [Caldilineae bacterium]|nr:MAG: molybdopterin oxidoreductase family protein [Caldilineae bacterium]
MTDSIQRVNGVCPHDCPDTCAWQVSIDEASGRALRMHGHPHHPLTQGRLCGKVERYLERVYHPGRLTTPLKRIGVKGEGRFQAITWDQAISEIAERLQQIIGAYGAEAVLPYSYAGTMGLLQGEGMAARFFNRMGASRLARTICSEAGSEGYSYTIGAAYGMEPQDFAHARLILIWGSNTLTSNMHLWPFIQTARKAGARVLVIDPARTRTARVADEWIPIRPGTDGALALALMHVIITEELYDGDYVARYTLGFEQLSERVQAYGPEWAAGITGIPAGRIRELARLYANAQPAAIRVNYGLQRHAGGGMAVRNIACLPALVGAWRYRGGGILLSTSGIIGLDRTPIQRPDLLAGRNPRTLNMIRLGDALSPDPERLARAHYRPRPCDPAPSPAHAGPPVKALIVYNSNPAAVAPDQNAVLAGLRRPDLFTVVLEHFQTDTADYADYLLPATTQLEHWDLHKAYGHFFIALNRPAIAPLGQALPNSEIFRRLAAAMDYDEPCFRQEDVEILRELLAAQTHPCFEGITWERLRRDGFARLNLPSPFLPFAEGGFPTPSGKCEFYSRRMAEDGYDPLPAWIPPKSIGPRPTSGGEDRLWLISPPAHNFLNTTFANLERFRQREGEPLLWLHPQDAAPRGIADGWPVQVRSEQGEVRLRARVTTDIIPGCVLAPTIWWNKLSPGGGNVNRLTDQTETDMGGSPTFYDVLVTVEPWNGGDMPRAQEEIARPMPA